MNKKSYKALKNCIKYIDYNNRAQEARKIWKEETQRANIKI